MHETREEKAIIVDFLPNGYPLEPRRIPIAQAIGLSQFTLLELVPRKGIKLQLKEEVYIGPGKRDKIYFIKGRLQKSKLTQTAKIEIKDFVDEIVKNQEKQFIDFLNSAGAVNTRLHKLELLPGFGKKCTGAIIQEREKKPFTSYKDVNRRLKNVPHPEKVFKKRLIEEFTQDVRCKLFVA